MRMCMYLHHLGGNIYGCICMYVYVSAYILCIACDNMCICIGILCMYVHKILYILNWPQVY